MQFKLSRRTFITSAAASVPSAVAHARPNSLGFLSALGTHSAITKPLDGSAKDAGVIDLSQSRFAKLKTVPVRAVVIQDGFWSKRRRTNAESSIPSMREELVTHGRMTNFVRLEGKSKEPQKGPVYSDSDIYKWTEAAAFQLQVADDPNLRSTVDSMIRDIVAVQEPSGYLNTYYVDDRKPLRMQYDTQTTGHGLYCIGHLLHGAIAYCRATGDPTLLNAGIRFVDDFLLPNYGPGPNQKGIVAGHPEIEMALIELARTTGERKYVDLA